MRRLVFAAALLIAAVSPAITEAAERDRYDFTVALDMDTAIARVEQRVTFTNRAEVPIDSIEMLVPAARSGAFRLGDARLGDRTLVARFAMAGLSLTGLDPIAPGNLATVRLNYEIRVPERGSLRLGQYDGTLIFGSWYASLFPLGSSGWRKHEYTEAGDAFVVDDIDVIFSLASNREVTLVAQGQSLEASPSKVFATRVDGVRDYAFVVTPRLSSVRAGTGRTRIVAHGRADEGSLTASVARVAADYARWLVERIGPLPYDRVDIVITSAQPDQVGQEFHRIVFLNRALAIDVTTAGSYFNYLIAHEVTHFWFHGLVGSDPVREPWLDEALATYLPERYFDEAYSNLGASRIANLRQRVASDAARFGSLPITTPLADFADEDAYFAVVYRRGAVFLDELWRTVGDAPFWSAMHAYVAQASGRIATGEDFHRAFDRASPADLRAIRAQYLVKPLAPSRDSGTSGRYFDETGGFTVSNADRVPFWDEFNALGGVAALGYPVSGRFLLDGFTLQAFQRAILQWRPEVRKVYFVNVLDRLSEAGRDDWLLIHRMTPRPSDPSPDTGVSWDRVVARRQAMLDVDPALRSAYFAVPNPIDRYGLPVSVADVGNAIVVRSQRAVLQLWKIDVPWARAGQVTIANAGDLAKESGLLPPEAIIPEPRPPAS